jgi:hypothetical protein
MKTRWSYAILLSLSLSVLFSADAFAQDNYRSQYARSSYTIAIMTLSVNSFWQETGRMPYSIDEVYQAGLLPKNLKNPVTGNVLNLYAQSPAVGEFVYTRSSDEHASFVFTREDNSISELPMDASHLVLTTPEPDNRVSIFQVWGLIALESYYKDTRQIPVSLTELQGAGYWPFTDERNPITGESLDYYTVKPGNICFRFMGNKVYVYAIASDSSHSTLVLDPAQSPWLQY